MPLTPIRKINDIANKRLPSILWSNIPYRIEIIKTVWIEKIMVVKTACPISISKFDIPVKTKKIKLLKNGV